MLRFNNALTPVYFRRADAFVIVYDVTDVSSFRATKKWVSVIKVCLCCTACQKYNMATCMYMQAALREQSPVIMLVGNKSDKLGQRAVAIEDGRKLALVRGSCYRTCINNPYPILELSKQGSEVV